MILFAAMLARGNELDNSKVTTNDEIHQFLNHAFKDMGVKPDKKERQISVMGVQALLAEGNFINEALDYRLTHEGADFPPEFREKMLNAIQRMVGGFQKDTGKSD